MLTNDSGICLIRIILICFNATVTSPEETAKAAHHPEAARVQAGHIDTPIRSKDLFESRNCVYIEHEGMIYALRTTRAGKLILTK